MTDPSSLSDDSPGLSELASRRDGDYSVVRIEKEPDRPWRGATRLDTVVIEEPMEIRVIFGKPDAQIMRCLTVTMRTPGDDEELAAGFLLTEGILRSADEISGFKILGNDADGNATGNIVRVDMRPDVTVDFSRIQRNFVSTSSCGVCGKASLDALQMLGLKPLDREPWRMSAQAVCGLPDTLRKHQPTFSRTGGLHAAGLFRPNRQLIEVREDVGRHNAVDKLIGCSFLRGDTPLSDSVMVISGRASFEIMQKAIAAGIAMVVAVGAPSSLAVETAIRYNVTLVGFASPDHFNVYSVPQRIEMS